MPYEMPITVAAAVEGIKAKKYVLPAIQRAFVWGPEKIELLFDSLLQGYPIGMLLVWRAEGEALSQYTYYDFIRDFHERDNKENPKANLVGEHEVKVVLDGQQRLTALYVGLLGTAAYRLKGKHRSSAHAYPKRRLFVDLVSPLPESADAKYNFKFLTDSESKTSPGKHWFLVGKTLELSFAGIGTYLTQNGLSDNAFAAEVLSNLYESIRVRPVLPYNLEYSTEMDQVLSIFVRTNSAGTPLSYSDLLLSVATANWPGEENAREKVNKLVAELNDIGEGFQFDKDFVLKSSLVLGDADVAFKVANLESGMRSIALHWEEIAQSLKVTVELVESFGFNGDTLTSQNALIPVAYYIKQHSIGTAIVTSSAFKDDREIIRKWLILTLLKRTFSGQSDNVLRWTREVLRGETQTFPLKRLNERLAQAGKTLKFEPEELESLLEYEYREPLTFSILALLYPTLDFKNRFHKDHIHPQAGFAKKKMSGLGVVGDLAQRFLDREDRIGNLQLLEGPPNIEKSDTSFGEWLAAYAPTQEERADFMKRHYIPDLSLEFKDFIGFCEAREAKLLDRLQELTNL